MLRAHERTLQTLNLVEFADIKRSICLLIKSNHVIIQGSKKDVTQPRGLTVHVGWPSTSLLPGQPTRQSCKGKARNQRNIQQVCATYRLLYYTVARVTASFITNPMIFAGTFSLISLTLDQLHFVEDTDVRRTSLTVIYAGKLARYSKNFSLMLCLLATKDFNLPAHHLCVCTLVHV